MRHCNNESVEVYETQGENLGLLLIEAAGLLHSKGDVMARVTTEPQVDPDTGRFVYVVTVYVHG